MKDEAKCNCQHCSGHVSFPVEMVGQTISCPHCQLETMLFIPPADMTAPQSAPAKKGIPLVWWIFGSAALAFLLLFTFLAGFAFLQRSPGKNEQVSEPNLPNQTNQITVEPKQSSPQQTNLKPVDGAFGYKLGDKVSGEIDDYMPLRDTPPFDEFSIDRLSDGRICQITAMGIVEESDLYDCRKRLISVLTEKYGARGKMGAEKYALDLGGENYYFGTTDRVAYLAITDNQTNAFFHMDYYDVKLRAIYFDEQEVIRQKDEEDKKAALRKGL